MNAPTNEFPGNELPGNPATDYWRPGGIGAPVSRRRREPAFDLFRASQRLDGAANPVGRLFYALNQNVYSVLETNQ